MFRNLLLALVLFNFTTCTSSEINGQGCFTTLKGWSEPKDGRLPFTPMNIIAFTKSGITLNGKKADKVILLDHLTDTKDGLPMTLTVLDPTDAPSCDKLIEHMEMVNKAVDCNRPDACGLGTKDDWENAKTVNDVEPIS